MARRLASCANGLRASGLLLALVLLAGCKTLGESGMRDELERLRAERDFAVLSSQPDRVAFAARGQRVVVEPPAGYCLDQDALKATRNSAFALITDCLADRQVEIAANTQEGDVLAIELPRSFPGIMTVSISGEPGLGPGAASLDAFEALLRSAPGRALLSRGMNGASGEIVATRRVGGAIYVLIEEEPEHPGFLAPQFWRGFIDLNERLVLVTVSVFSDRPVAEDGMMAFLASQMSRLRRSNGLAADAEEDRIARQLAAVFAEPTDESVEVIRSERRAVSEDGVAPRRAPRPTLRDVAASAPGRAQRAPARVPLPPARPSVRAAVQPALQPPAPPPAPPPAQPSAQPPAEPAGQAPVQPPVAAAVPPPPAPAAASPPVRPSVPTPPAATGQAPLNAPLPPRRPR